MSHITNISISRNGEQLTIFKSITGKTVEVGVKKDNKVLYSSTGIGTEPDWFKSFTANQLGWR